MRRVREVRLSLPVSVQRDQFWLRGSRRKGRFEEWMTCGYLLVVSDPVLRVDFSPRLVFQACHRGRFG